MISDKARGVSIRGMPLMNHIRGGGCICPSCNFSLADFFSLATVNLILPQSKKFLPPPP